uniref:Putative secreted salivary protein salp15ir-3 n=1 Tax=Ixodes ricinus TaxID=34613 RepID=V5IBE6_IXORI
MKVVCIILLFGIAAETSSTAKTRGETGSQGNLPLKFPQFITKPKELALRLLKLCNEHKEKHSKSARNGQTSDTAINDGKVDFKNCTFLCKHGQHVNVTLNLPDKTPCGPSGQTCADKSKCVGYIPGC